jgi:IclR family transcriptional regulator, KDG regulon repressor
VAVDEEFEPGLAGVSVPVRDFRGRVAAALNVSAPATRLRPVIEAVGQRTVRAAAEVSSELGWNPSRARMFEGPA